MAEAMEATPFREEWDQFFHLENQENLLATISTKEPGAFAPLDDDSTSPTAPSLEFHSASTGNSSPSEIDNLAHQFSPVYQLPASMDSPTRNNAANPKKRKNLDASAVPAATTTRQPRGQKISHNVIEKRYRSNLNDKIAKLRDSVPELRTAAPTVKRRPAKAHASDSDASGDDGAGLKFNKATVLTKATEYIQQLERQNQKLASELSMLRNRAGPVEKLRNPPVISTAVVDYAVSTPIPKAPSTAPSTIGLEHASPTDTAMTSPGLIRVPDDVRRLREEARPEHHYAASLPGFNHEVEQQPDPFNQPIQGMIPVPESMRRLREAAAAQDHFAPESSYYSALVDEDEFISNDDHGEQSNWPRSKALSRVLIGSLAGLMVMEGLSEKESGAKGLEKRGLFALPTDLVTESRGFRAQIRRRIIHFAASIIPRSALPILSIAITLLMLCFVVFVYVAPNRSKATQERGRTTEATKLVGLRAEGSSSQSRAPPDPPLNRTYSPPPDAFELQSSSWDLQLIDRLTMEWFGLSIPSSGVDEEAARRAAHPRRDLKALRTIMQRLFLQRSMG